MDKQDSLELVQKVYQKTLAYDIEKVNVEDIPNKIASILSKALKREVEVEGDGLTKELYGQK